MTAIRENALYNKTILTNGLRIVSEKIPYTRSVAIGIWIDIGSRDESAELNGISHFIEHMLFKGTRNRTAQNIAFSLESLGGSLNAFTSREQTCYHAVVLDEHLDQAVDVLADILMYSTLTPANIEREKQVVIEEIREIDETPADHIHELFSNSFWYGQSLGRPIMGTEAIVRSFSRPIVKAYMNRHYRGGRVVVSAAGNVSHRKLVNLIKDKLDFPAGCENRGEPAVYPGGFTADFFRNDSNQTHICVGFPGISYADSRRITLLALNNYLGGGMSSILFQKIREDKGIAYTVYTFADFYRDCGILGAYLATDRSRLNEALETMLREFHKMKTRRLSRTTIEKIKDQLKGSLLLGQESTQGRMNRLGRQETLTESYFSLRDAIKAINSITADDLIEISRIIFDSNNATVTALGSASRKDLNQVNWSILA
nr:insulinase family protein [candidate division Zixibacteria bacterium]